MGAFADLLAPKQYVSALLDGAVNGVMRKRIPEVQERKNCPCVEQEKKCLPISPRPFGQTPLYTTGSRKMFLIPRQSST